MGHLLAVIMALLSAQLQVARQSSASLRANSARAATVAAAAASGAAAPGAAAPAPVPRASSPALTLRRLVGQQMIFAYDGLEPPPALRRRIARGEAAGVILFARNVRSAGQVAAVVRSLQAIARPPGLRAPLLVMVDQEGGPVRRLPGGPVRAAADVASAAEARADGREAARVLRAAGANMDLAPVSDVARPGSALEGERRTYGRDAQHVASLAGAFAAGLHDGGVRATAKHFPGFGAATVNTDDAPARIGASLSTLRSTDATPF
ncbi:MAG: beta-N-acetylhexosaminidase, partial [Solirubrobacteraceae bacterium]|nr:beta-N-acetylhexosaminidase [Solirubrobacteraceae bacterium]